MATEMATERYEVIPAGYTPEDWAAFGPEIMARLKTETAHALAGHRINEPHDCFAMNCSALGDELRRLQERLISQETHCLRCEEVVVYRRGDSVMHVGCAIGDDADESERIYGEQHPAVARAVAALRLALADAEASAGVVR